MNDTSRQPISGSCLCGEVRYRFTGNLGIFQNCQCSRCRKFTGSAFAANLFVSPEQFHWLAGESQIGRYAPEETRHFTNRLLQKLRLFPALARQERQGGGRAGRHPGSTPGDRAQPAHFLRLTRRLVSSGGQTAGIRRVAAEKVIHNCRGLNSAADERRPAYNAPNHLPALWSVPPAAPAWRTFRYD